jgi:hypothetical protein
VRRKERSYYRHDKHNRNCNGEEAISKPLMVAAALAMVAVALGFDAAWQQGQQSLEAMRSSAGFG